MPRLENRASMRRPPIAGQERLILRVKGPNGGKALVNARVVDISERGIGLEIGGALDRGELVEIAGDMNTPDGRPMLSRLARVRWCSPAQKDRYRAGLSFEPVVDNCRTIENESADGEEDHYEVLQLSPNADAETIQRVFRIIAQRYHPDNLETGNTDLFRKVKQSYDVLSDLEKRAAYDVRRNAFRKDRLKIFSGWQSCTGIEAEKRKRQGILTLLYAQRANDSRQPGLTIRELEDLLACPREQLEFALWFLKERKYVARSDNNRHSITWEGVAAAERAHLAVPNSGRKRLAPPA